MADHWNALGGKLGYRVEAAGAVECIAAEDQRGMGRAQIILIGAELAIDQADLDEAIPRRLAHLLGPDRLDVGENVDARRARRCRFLNRIDEQHRKLALCL
jgi:hypothetical protein